MYKAKILKINQDRTFSIDIPSLRLNDVLSYALVQSKSEMNYGEGDLVIVSETNDHNWVILGLVYGPNN
jgi:hypothetical protein